MAAVDMATATFKGGPLDGETLRLPAGSWREELWGHGALGGRYVRWAIVSAGVSFIPGDEGSAETSHLYEWVMAA